MSCALNKLASIRNINGILEWFQLDSKEQEEIAWDANWESWDGNEMETESQKSECDWIGKCLSCISSMGNVAAIAHKNRIAILTANDMVDDDETTTLSVTWKGTVGDIDNDEITDIMCLPLASQNTSSAGTPDWTSIIIGFKSGSVSVYGENGILLFSQIYEESPVVKLHCRTFTLGDFDISLFSDMSTEFVVAYQKCVVSINGNHFLDTLRLCRKRAAKALAGSVKLEGLPPLKYKKYTMAEQEYLASCASAGSLMVRMYEKLVQESLCKGFTEFVGASLIWKGHLLTVGEMPYFGVIELSEETAQFHVRDLAFGLAAKLKNRVMSAASDWLFPLTRSSSQEPSKPVIEPATTAYFRTFLPDRRRMGVSVALSPSRRLAAVTDSFGRVVVVDVLRGIAIKMWKGYRDAECGWQEVVDEWGGEKRKVTFLIIYAPRRGLLEVWLPQQGQRIAAFNVSKQAKLLYAHHIVLGYASYVREVYHSYPVLLLNPTGVVESVHIPFHLALSSKTDRQARDQHLLKEINSYIKKIDDESVISLVKELETTYGKLQLIIMLLAAKNFSLYLVENILDVLTKVNEEQPADDGEDETVKTKKSSPESNYSSYELKKLNVSLKKIRRLLEFYKYVTAEPKDQFESFGAEDETKKILAKLVMITVDEVDRFPVLSSEDQTESSAKKAKVEKISSLDFHSYMNSFQIIGSDVNYDSDVAIRTNKSVLDHAKVLTNLMFSHCDLTGFEEFLSAIDASGIEPLDLMELAFLGWYEINQKSIPCALKFSLTVTGLFFLKGDFFEVKDDITPFWFVGLKCIYPWTDIPEALLAAVICRGLDQVSANFLQKAQVNPDDDLDRIRLWGDFMQHLQSEEYKYISLNEWEQTSPHLVEWNIFIGRIKRLSGVYDMLRKQKSHDAISVRILMENGNGYISELVARYLIKIEISSASLKKILDRIYALDNSFVVEGEEELDPELSPIYEDINAFREHFLVSLGNCSILCNICWELGVLWQKDPNETSYLTRLVEFFKLLDYKPESTGTGILIWQLLLRDRLANVIELTEKHKRIPSDRMSIENVGISQPTLAAFFTESRMFLDSLLDLISKKNTASPLASSPNRDAFSNNSDRASLVERAQNADAELSPKMIYLHIDLIIVLEFFNDFNITDVRIHTLFSDEQRRVFFKPFTDLIYYPNFLTVTPTVFEGRIEFLKKIISKGVEELPDNFDEPEIRIALPDFFSKVIELARMWQCDVDIIRRQYIVELMYSGFDTKALEAMRWLNLVGDLPEMVFHIAGLRLQYLIDTLPSPELVKLVTSISPLISNWSRQLSPLPLRNPKVPMLKTSLCMASVFEFLSTTSSHYTPGKYFLLAKNSLRREGF